MLKYHVAVCDDEKSDLDGIVQSVQRYDVQGCFDIETYMDGNELLSELQMQKKSFDLLLLDIEMPSNGFQLAQSLIQMEKHPLVVFVTKRHEYAVQGYGIAFRYLVKPLDQTLFAAAMDAVLQELNSKHFTIEYDGVTMSLETSDIYFLESHGHKVLIHCKEQDDASCRHTKVILSIWNTLFTLLEPLFFFPADISYRSAGGSVRSSIRTLTLIWEDDALLFR